MDISPKRLSFPPDIAERLKASPLKIFITGASGWIGKALLEMCESCFGEEFNDRVAAFASKPGELNLRSGRCVNLHSLQELPQLARGEWLLCHLAFLGKEKVAQLGLAAFIEGNKIIRSYIDRAITRTPPKAIFYSSSGAVYGEGRELIRGMNISPYGALKVLDEEHFANSGIKTVIPRIFNISGPYINKWQVYALSSLIMQGMQDRSMQIQAKHPVIRSYVHVEDVISPVFEGLFGSEIIYRFDTASDDGVELQELAEVINEVVFDNALPIIRSGFDASLKADCYIGRSDIKATRNLREQIRETADYLSQFPVQQ